MVAGEESAVRFDEDIRPIFAKHCVACHGGVKQASGLSFIYREKVLAGGESGQPAVVPGDVEASYLIDRVTDADPEFADAAGGAWSAPLDRRDRPTEAMDPPGGEVGPAVGIRAAEAAAAAGEFSRPIGASRRSTISCWLGWKRRT